MPSRRPPSQRDPQFQAQRLGRSLAQQVPGLGKVANASPGRGGSGVGGRAEMRGIGTTSSPGLRFFRDRFELDEAEPTLTLSFLPVADSAHVYLNGVEQDETVDWTRDGAALTVLAGMDARVDDVLEVRYAYASGQPQLVDEQTYTLSFELAPDSIATGGPGHTATIDVTCDGANLGSFISAVEAGNDDVYDWRAWTVDLPPTFNPHASHLTFGFVVGMDHARVRRIKVLGSGGSVLYGSYPATHPWTAAVQDGADGLPYVMVDGVTLLSEYNAATGLHSAPTEADGRLHLYMRGA